MRNGHATKRTVPIVLLGEADSAVRELLSILVASSDDESIKKYSKAIGFYSEHLRETWD